MGLLNTADWTAKWIRDPAAETHPVEGKGLNGYHSQFADSSQTTKWVGVDLGALRTIDGVALFPARPYDWQPETPGFLFPLRYRVEVSTTADLQHCQVVVDKTTIDQPNPGNDPVVHKFSPVPARYVRLVVTRLRERDAGKHAFALAELEILYGTTNLARHCSAAALDSIETGAWALTNLTDGITDTVAPTAHASLPATMFRKEFKVAGNVRKATAYTTAEGVYEIRINGHRVGDHILAPEWTSYRRRLQYQTYDITRLVRPGKNAVAAMVGEGWFAGRLMIVGRFSYGTCPALLLQLEIETSDGRREIIATDETWRSTTNGPITSASIYDGETYDARREFDGWDEAGFDDANWNRVIVRPLDGRALVWQPNEPVRVTRELIPVRITEPKPNVYVVDFGQNVVGWCMIKANGKKGIPVTLRHAEMLNDDGTLYTANLRGAAQTDVYIPRTDGVFEFQPHFTYHGFRYVELTGLPSKPPSNAVRARIFHSDAQLTGHFKCSDPALNRLMENILWTQRANLMGTPNDCPQRDERFGWMGDIQVFAQTAMFNMDMAAFFTKWLQDVRDDQAMDGRFPDFAPHPGNPNVHFSGAPAWADAGVIVPWQVWQNYSDKRLLDLHFESARRWVDHVHRENPDLIWRNSRGNDYNDWLNGDWIRYQNWPTNGASVPKEVFATAFFAHSAGLVSRMASITGRTNEAKYYNSLSDQIKSAFNKAFVGEDGLITGDTQAGYALALNFDLLPDKLRPAAAQRLVDNIRRYGGHLSTGIQTTHRAMLELVRTRHEHLAWQLLTNRAFPSWLYMLENGATTVWERWDGYVRGRGFQDPGMNSFNHWAFGAVGEWVWKYIAGLSPCDSVPGWKHFLVAPRPGGSISWAKARYASIHGAIVVEWELKGSDLVLKLVVPPNTHADVRLPAPASGAITESARPWS
ncbi:MAG: family 78 glycoside hydrolase catalytic domain, partial [Verrucomicrobiae bacterium]|nr:family 78 glycoside hydrolase catalytic domain [Verrucomicrobiae bacterium]